MKLLSCAVANFGSYENLEFNFEAQGLSLLYGPTGAGKSTIMDIPLWILHGVTAKGGTVDEVRSWQAKGEPTVGILYLETASGKYLSVSRTRGKPQENDLYFVNIGPDTLVRGKDITETQKLLNAELGFDSELYILSAYFCEASEVSQFFTAKATARRTLFERLADMSLPTTLSEASSAARKGAKDNIKKAQSEVDRLSGAQESARDNLECAGRSFDAWNTTQKASILALEDKVENFEADKERDTEVALKAVEDYQDKMDTETKGLAEVLANTEKALASIPKVTEAELAKLRKKLDVLRASPNKCPTCGAAEENDKLEATFEELRTAEMQWSTYERVNDNVKAAKRRLQEDANKINPHIAKLEAILARENHYAEQLEAKKAEKNPFIPTLKNLNAKLKELDASYIVNRDNLTALSCNYNDLNRLYDLCSDLRGELLAKAVKSIERRTNELFETYFDAEMRISLSVDGDKLEVSIQKSGYDCTYRQLSKGQKCLLKLCFAIPVMEAASARAGVHFDALWFDEALDGLDSDMKQKVFLLFQSLEAEHSSVFVIDHAPELQNLFTNRYKVSMVEDKSVLEKDEQS